MKHLQKLKHAATGLVVVGALALSATQGVHAGVIVIGNDVVDRPSQDTWRDFVVSLDTEIFPVDGQVIDWSVYASTAGELALLILDQGVVVSSDQRYVNPGYNAFAFVPDSGDSLVAGGYNVGLWMGDAVVDFSYGTPGIGEDGLDIISWCPSNGCSPYAPTAGDALEFVNWSSQAYRTYSVSVTDPPLPTTSAAAPVPVPATMLLLLLGLIGSAVARRQS